MKIAIDWTIPIVAGLSLSVSLLTLYIAHLRGPIISLIIPENPYPIISIRDEKSVFHHVLIINILIANTGIRSGVLHNLKISSTEKIYSSVHIDPKIGETLPAFFPQEKDTK